MATFVFVHGAWHGAWCWERVKPLLEEQGHTVLTPDLPTEQVPLDLQAKFIAGLIEEQKEPVILVGHSRAGIVISQAAEFVATRIAKLVYLTAFLVPPGATMWSILEKRPQEPNAPQDILVSEDRKYTSIAKDAIRRTFYNCTDEVWAKRAASLVKKEAVECMITPLRLTDTAYGTVPRCYIYCTKDKANPLFLQQSMVSAHPCSMSVTIDTDHSPFYSAPRELACQLNFLVSL